MKIVNRRTLLLAAIVLGTAASAVWETVMLSCKQVEWLTGAPTWHITEVRQPDAQTSPLQQLAQAAGALLGKRSGASFTFHPDGTFSTNACEWLGQDRPDQWAHGQWQLDPATNTLLLKTAQRHEQWHIEKLSDSGLEVRRQDLCSRRTVNASLEPADLSLN